MAGPIAESKPAGAIFKLRKALSEGGPGLVVRRAIRLLVHRLTRGMPLRRSLAAAQARLAERLGGDDWKGLASQALLLLDAHEPRDALLLLAEPRARSNRSLRFLADTAEFEESHKGRSIESLRSSLVDSENRISVVVPYYNHLPYLEMLLHGLALQTYRKFEVVVIDDRSDPQHDPLPTIATWSRDLDIKYERLQRKGFTSGARQRGAQLATGDILSFIDADDVPHAQRLQCVNYLFASRPIVHLTHGFETFTGCWNDRDRELFSDVEEIDRAVVDDRTLRALMRENVAEGRWADGSWNHGSYGMTAGHGTQAGHLSYVRALAEETPWRGGKDAIFSLCEDYDMNMQLLFRYRGTAHVDLPLSGYRVGSTTHSGQMKGLY